jgi:hypothetical protein
MIVRSAGASALRCFTGHNSYGSIRTGRASDVSQRGPRTDEVLQGTDPRMQRTGDEAEGSPGYEFGVEVGTGTSDARNRAGQRTDLPVRSDARIYGAEQLSRDQQLTQIKGVGTPIPT